MCPEATDDEALAALEDKQGKCVLPCGSPSARLARRAATGVWGRVAKPCAFLDTPFARSEDEAAAALTDPEYLQYIREAMAPVQRAAPAGRGAC